MALPDGGGLSSVYVTGPYIAPDDRKALLLRDWELGGVALNNTSKGLMYQVWTLEWYNGVMYLSAPNIEGRIVLFEVSSVVEVSLAFDGNMAPFVAYMRDIGGVLKYESWYYWYDTVVAQFVHTKLPDFSYYPKCCLDDKRPLANTLQSQDIILSYMREDKLYVREQKDRYLIEKLEWTGFRARLNKVGMNIHNRLQWQLEALPPE